MSNRRCAFSLLLLALLVPTQHLSAQNSVLTNPGTVSLFRPFGGLNEGAFTNLPFNLSLTGLIGYDDNVLTSHSDRVGSGYDSAGLVIQSHIGAERTRLDVSGNAGFNYYWERPGTKIDPNLYLSVNFTHQFTPRLILGVTSYSAYQGQADVTVGASSAVNNGNYFYTSNALTLGYQWTPRFSTTTSYTLNAIHYEQSAPGNNQNRLENYFDQQFRYLVLPTITGVLEYRFGYVSYDVSAADSYSNFILGGADLTLNPRSSLTLRGGMEIRTLLGGQEGSVVLNSGNVLYPYFESNLVYQLRTASTIGWYNRFGLEASDLATFSGTAYKQVYRTGLRLNQSFSLKLTGEAGVYYSYNQYKQPSFEEQELDLNGSLAYKFTRSLSANVGYTFTRIFSQMTERDYYRNRVYLGLSFAF
ncbi:MAG: outer membrane beta-barrel protein [Verrucomicrobia bacterium]|nr:outer membrane beta-barrel protein [Verrucomicrobiota bacterium]